MTKTIYVSIPCLHDEEIFNTLDDIYRNADNPERLTVSVSFFLNDISEEYTEKIKQLLPSNVISNFYLHSDFMGVGIARLLSKKDYSNQDYFLQIDSHTMLNKSWDTNLISYLSEAKKIYGKSSVLTGYLSAYHYSQSGEKEYISRNIPMYPLFVSDWNQINSNTGAGQWKLIHDNMPQSITLENFYIDEHKKYEMCNKFNANFIFADKKFANDYEKFFPFNFLFFEEEFIMSVEMFNAGYLPIYPNFDIGLAHLYFQNAGPNQYRNVLDPRIEHIEESEKNIADYLDNNREKIVSFYRYANINEDTNLSIKSDLTPNNLRN